MSESSSANSTYVDVLIIGAGPAGLMASLALAEMGITHRIVDKLGTRALNGRADGFHVRTVEIWNSFGLQEKLHKYGHHFGEWALWTMDGNRAGISRSLRTPTIGEAATGVRTGTFHQGFIEAALIDAGRKRGAPRVERGTTSTTMKIDEDQINNHEAYPIAVELEHLRKENLEDWPVNAHSVRADGSFRVERGSIDAFGTDPDDIIASVSGEEGSTETVHAKYIIGGDGGHSWVRHQLPEFRMEGASSDSAWAVIDIVPITDFPDIRRNCTILSEHGTILIIPRENGLSRLYIQLSDDTSAQHWKADGKFSTVRAMMDIARRIFAPYGLEYRYCDWWTIYRVGQRVCNHFAFRNRVFLTGDAVHTHTPKGGQGMNVSQQDAYNLAWKMAGVINKQLDPEVLSTYETERRPLAQALIDLDTDLAHVLDAASTASRADVDRVYARLAHYGSGINITYQPSLVVSGAQTKAEEAASRLKLGTRISESTVYNQASSTPTRIHSLLRTNGTWRILAFAGDVTTSARLATVNEVGAMIEKSVVMRNRPSPKTGRPFAEVFMMHAMEISQIESTAFPSVFFPTNSRGEHNYETIFAESTSTEQHHVRIKGVERRGVYDDYGISKGSGALVLLRPDQIVAWVGHFSKSGVESMASWLETVTGERCS